MIPQRTWHDSWYPIPVNRRAITQRTEQLRYGDEMFIRFAVAPDAWNALEAVFHALRVAKESPSPGADWQIADWLSYKNAAPQTFFVPDTVLTDAETVLRSELAARLDNSKRSRFRLRFQEGYSYRQALFEIFFMDDYRPAKLFRIGRDTGVLTYTPNGFPFGGSWALVALIEGFGHKVIYDSYNGGTPPKRLAGWNTDRAIALLKRFRSADGS